jgi:hypothetical protein
VRAYREENALRVAADKCSDLRTDFDVGWNHCVGRFPKLQEFCGGLASIFPNTSTVESDFSVIGWEKDEYRQCLTDFSLESIVHAKQFDRLHPI